MDKAFLYAACFLSRESTRLEILESLGYELAFLATPEHARKVGEEN
jgi:hypothetical protein